MEAGPEVTLTTIRKVPTGIAGFDDITGGGLPAGRTTLLCGGPGCGKTLMSMGFLVHGATASDEPGVMMSFEESAGRLAENVASLGWDIDDLIDRQLLAVDQVHIPASERGGEGWNLDGVLLRLASAIEAVGARRVVIDSIETLFETLSNPASVRAELHRLVHWLDDHGVTTIVTAERGTDTLTRHGLEAYVADCVVLLDSRLVEQVLTRRLRIVKYRGSHHGPDEYPFLIDGGGVAVAPVSSMRLDHDVSLDRVSTGNDRLDEMLGGGVYRGTSVLFTGPPGSAKTTLAASALDAACRRGERAVLFAFEESPQQIARNMGAVGLQLQRWQQDGLLTIRAHRPTEFGLEMHLARITQAVREIQPAHVVLDPISALGGDPYETTQMLSRTVDFLKQEGVTSYLTAVTHGDQTPDVGISSTVDTWITVSVFTADGERRRGIDVLKSRGMEHSHRLHEFRLGPNGVEILAPPSG